MPGKKSLTIGITVNLENYENLRLEVTGEVTDQMEVKDLVGFLDQTLTTFGRGNPATIALIEKYRARVLSSGDGSASTSEPTVYAHESEPEWPDMEAPALPQQPLTPPARETLAPVAEAAAPAASAAPAIEKSETKAIPAQKPEKPKKLEKQLEPVIQPEPVPAAQTPPQVPQAPVPVAAPVSTPAAPPQPAASAAACEICGCAVSSSEQKMSQLFMSRTLCKTCMKKA